MNFSLQLCIQNKWVTRRSQTHSHTNTHTVNSKNQPQHKTLCYFASNGKRRFRIADMKHTHIHTHIHMDVPSSECPYTNTQSHTYTHTHSVLWSWMRHWCSESFGRASKNRYQPTVVCHTLEHTRTHLSRSHGVLCTCYTYLCTQHFFQHTREKRIHPTFVHARTHAHKHKYSARVNDKREGAISALGEHEKRTHTAASFPNSIFQSVSFRRPIWCKKSTFDRTRVHPPHTQLSTFIGNH